MISAIFAGLAIIVAFMGAYLVYKNRKTKSKQTVGFVLVAVALVSLFVVPASIHTVQTGEIAVVKHLGEATKVRTPGTYFDFWITEKYDVYDSKVQNLELVTKSYSKDAQTMDVTMIVQYQIDQTKAIDIAKQYGSVSVIENRLASIAVEKTKSTLSSYSAMTIIETRSSVSPQVEEVIKTAVNEEYCVDIVAVVLTNIDFSDAFEQTVEDKMIAEQEKLKAEYEKETAIINAEKELEVAKLAAQAKLEQAKADAQAQIEIASAEAKATKIKAIEVARALGFTITEKTTVDGDGIASVEYTIDFEGKTTDEIKLITDYLKYIEYLAKWDGKLPNVIAGDTATIVIPGYTENSTNP